MTPRCRLCEREIRSSMNPAEAWIVVDGNLLCGECWERTGEQIRKRESDDRGTIEPR